MVLPTTNNPATLLLFPRGSCRIKAVVGTDIVACVFFLKKVFCRHLSSGDSDRRRRRRRRRKEIGENIWYTVVEHSFFAVARTSSQLSTSVSDYDCCWFTGRRNVPSALLCEKLRHPSLSLSQERLRLFTSCHCTATSTS